MTIITKKAFNRRGSAIRTDRRHYGNGSGCPGPVCGIGREANPGT